MLLSLSVAAAYRFTSPWQRLSLPLTLSLYLSYAFLYLLLSLSVPAVRAPRPHFPLVQCPKPNRFLNPKPQWRLS